MLVELRLSSRLTLIVAVLLSASSAFAGASEDCAAVATSDQQDYVAAFRLCRPLAERGDAKAQSALGFMYTNGEGVPQDFREAAKWYRKAAEHGYAWAQRNLASMYEDGRGVPRNYVLAHMWLNLAAAHSRTDFADYGNNAGVMYEMTKSVAKDRDRLAEKMTPEQITEAQRLAREWKPTK